jgi:hypothetical protein
MAPTPFLLSLSKIFWDNPRIPEAIMTGFFKLRPAKLIGTL